MFKKIQQSNPDLSIFAVTDKKFSQYGEVLNFKCDGIKKRISQEEIPAEGNIYQACVEELSQHSETKEISEKFYQGSNIQVGFCHGNNSLLGAVEYHEGKEVLIALAPVVLFLGLASEIKDNHYETNRLDVFYLEEGEMVSLHPRVLHFSPCRVLDHGFKTVIILPEMTNRPLKEKDPADPTLFAQDKWVLIHPENTKFIERGAYVGLEGKNYIINTIQT